MRVAIIGGGAIGLLFSYHLKKEHDVVLYVRRQSQKAEIEAKGIVVRKREDSFHTYLDVKGFGEWEKDAPFDLVIVCVKQYQLQTVLEKISLSTEQTVLFIQNGMGHLKIIDQYKLEHVLVGSVEHGAYRENDQIVYHTGEGQTKIAVYQGWNQEIIRELMGSTVKKFPFSFEDDYKKMLQKKLVANAVINPLTALLEVQNGMLLDNPHYYQAFTTLFKEISNILVLEEEQLYFENVKRICRNTAHNQSSMLKDLHAGRETEVEAILGYLIDEAEKKNIHAPLITTFFHLIKGSEVEGGGK
ncbi:2-dehydropantoate 2-reductase [Robertmurraya massiliosenegalensis]|uniref:2-dehydropantoate 2-reductase n=1 Tax=Robertmurraya TaxID=2837507 RepID=UPI0039A4C8F2